MAGSRWPDSRYCLNRGDFFLKAPNLFAPAGICGIILLLMTFLAAYNLYRSQIVPASKILLLGMVIFYIPCAFGILPVLEDMKVTPSIAKAINKMTPIDIPVVAYKFEEPTQKAGK